MRLSATKQRNNKTEWGLSTSLKVANPWASKRCSPSLGKNPRLSRKTRQVFSLRIWCWLYNSVNRPVSRDQITSFLENSFPKWSFGENVFTVKLPVDFLAWHVWRRVANEMDKQGEKEKLPYAVNNNNSIPEKVSNGDRLNVVVVVAGTIRLWSGPEGG